MLLLANTVQCSISLEFNFVGDGALLAKGFSDFLIILKDLKKSKLNALYTFDDDSHHHDDCTLF